jgi:hypothetical protein
VGHLRAIEVAQPQALRVLQTNLRGRSGGDFGSPGTGQQLCYRSYKINTLRLQVFNLTQSGVTYSLTEGLIFAAVEVPFGKRKQDRRWRRY